MASAKREDAGKTAEDGLLVGSAYSAVRRHEIVAACGRRATPLAVLLCLCACHGSEIDESRLACFSACARRKDACVLAAMNAEAIQNCDAEGQRCSDSCEK